MPDYEVIGYILLSIALITIYLEATLIFNISHNSNYKQNNHNNNCSDNQQKYDWVIIFKLFKFIPKYFYSNEEDNNTKGNTSNSQHLCFTSFFIAHNTRIIRRLVKSVNQKETANKG
jgi:hypothetical protein